MQISAKELRTKTRLLLDAVDRGEEVTITYRGKPRARVVPLDAGPGERTKSDPPVFGIWKDRSDLEDVEGHVDAIRKARL